MTIRCEIVSQDRVVYEGDVDIVVVPGIEGEMGILPHHAPLLSTLNYGVVKIRTKEKEEIFTVCEGIIEVQPDLVTILTRSAENIEEINIARAESAKRRAEQTLVEGPPPDTDTYLVMEAALRRSNLRLETVRRYRRIGTRPSVTSIQDTGEKE